MTKLQKIGLVMSIVSAVLWTIWLFAWWNYDITLWTCDSLWLCATWPTYHLIHFIFIATFAIWIGLMLAEFSRKSLRMSCVISIISVLLWWFCVSFAFWNLESMCAWDCSEAEIPGHIFLILWLMFIILWFMSLFFTIKYLTNSNKLSVFGVLLVVILVVGLFVIFMFRSPYLLLGIETALNITFLMFWIVSIMLCIIAWIKGHKEAKKSS